MNSRWIGAVLATMALLIGQAPRGAGQEPTAGNPDPQVEDLGGGRYRIGAIHIDRNTRSFTLPAAVLRDEPPIEFLLSTRSGFKNYETVLEARADAYEFNLACILIGLDGERATPLEERFSGTPFTGDTVAITVRWQRGEQVVDVPAARLLLHGDPPQPVPDDKWIYTGGSTSPGGFYVPQDLGTLVGLVHRGESVIEHQHGVGVGAYGSIQVNNALLPGVGGEVTVTVANSTPTGADSGH